jgi:signal transduction histidine kinase
LFKMTKRRLVAGTAGIAMLAIFLWLIVTIYVAQIVNEQKGALVVSRSAKVEANALRSALADLELGYRLHHSTHNEKMLALYNLSKSNVQHRLITLQTLEQNSPRQLQTLRVVERGVRRLVETCESPDSTNEQVTDSLSPVLVALDEFDRLEAVTSRSRLLGLQSSSDAMNTAAVLSTAAMLLALCMSAVVLFFFLKESQRAEQLEKRNNLLEREVARRIFQHAPIGIARLSPDLTIKEANDSFANAFPQLDDDQVQNLSVVCPGLAEKLKLRVIERCRAFYEYESPTVTEEQTDWNPRYWNLWAWPILDEEKQLTEVVLVTMDVSDRVKLAQEREDLYAAIAHDLRVPLIGARRVLDLILEGTVKGKRVFELLSQLRKNNADILAQMTNLIELSRYIDHSGRTQWEVFDVCELIRSRVDHVSVLTEKSAVSVETDFKACPLMLCANKDAISRLLTNLLENAIKFTDHGFVRVKAWQEERNICLEVSDSGVGIPAEIQKHLFKRFWKGMPGRYQASTGFGLYMCNRIAELHNGTLECMSTPGEGSVFRVCIPNAEFHLEVQARDQSGRNHA